MKALVGVFNQAKALVGAFSVIVQLGRLIVCRTTLYLMAVLKSSSSVSRQEVLVTFSWRSLGTPSIRFSYITFLGIVTPGAGLVDTILACDWLISTIY